MSKPDIIQAHKYSANHRDQILASELCGCFYCTRTYPPSIIAEWVDEDDMGVGTTALCPRCGIDSVIGSAAGFPITQQFLEKMRKHWF